MIGYIVCYIGGWVLGLSGMETYSATETEIQSPKPKPKKTDKLILITGQEAELIQKGQHFSTIILNNKWEKVPNNEIEFFISKSEGVEIKLPYNN